MAAVAGASPVTMTARTPSVFSSEINAVESGRGGSPRAMIPASFSAAVGPMATARTRKPFASSSFAVLAASGFDCVSPATAAKAPLTARTVTPAESVAVASDIFVPGSNGTNLVSFGRSEAAFFAAVGTRQGSHSHHVRFVEARHDMDRGYRQCVLRQRSGLVRAQHIDACR